MGDCIYGPVPSRRLGRSLGIDLLPAKICTYDCIYCQLGKASSKTVKRRPYRETGPILDQLGRRLAENIAPDCITLAGSGEPTLNSQIGDVISGIKNLSDLPVVVLTNGALLSDPAVREALLTADIVIPSLDAHNPDLFATINRPHPAVDFDHMTAGLIAFAREFPGRLWLEIMIMAGINAADTDAEAFLPLVQKINPDALYVNTAVRPPREDFVQPVSDQRIAAFHQILDDRPQRDVTFSADTSQKRPEEEITAEIYDLIARRPTTREDIAAGLGLAREQVDKGLARLLEARQIEGIESKKSRYYRICPPDGA